MTDTQTEYLFFAWFAFWVFAPLTLQRWLDYKESQANEDRLWEEHMLLLKVELDHGITNDSPTKGLLEWQLKNHAAKRADTMTMALP